MCNLWAQSIIFSFFWLTPRINCMRSFTVLNKSIVASQFKLFFSVKWVGRVNDTNNELIGFFQIWWWSVQKKFSLQRILCCSFCCDALRKRKEKWARNNTVSRSLATRRESLRWVNETSSDTKFQKWSENRSQLHTECASNVSPINIFLDSRVHNIHFFTGEQRRRRGLALTFFYIYKWVYFLFLLWVNFFNGLKWKFDEFREMFVVTFL